MCNIKGDPGDNTNRLNLPKNRPPNKIIRTVILLIGDNLFTE